MSLFRSSPRRRVESNRPSPPKASYSLCSKPSSHRKLPPQLNNFSFSAEAVSKKASSLRCWKIQTSPPWRNKAKVNSNKRKLATQLRQPPAFRRKFRKRNWTRLRRKPILMLSKKYLTVAKNYSIRAPFRVVTWMRPRSHSRRLARNTKSPSVSSPICSASGRSKR